MACLTDVEIQAVADGEASKTARTHADECDICRVRVDDRRAEMARMAALVNTGDVPASVQARARHAIAAEQPVGGATRLRERPAVPAWRRAGLVSALATAAVIVLIVLGGLPPFGSPTSLSASEILGRSLETLTAAKGIERLEYDLTLSGVVNGRHRIVHLLDHDNPSRYKLSDFGPDGVLRTALSQDPAAGRRSHFLRVDDRNYIVNVANMHDTLPSLPQMAQAQLESVIAMLQATSDPKLTVLNSGSGRQYLIELPPIAPTTSATTLEIHQARVLIDGRDFRIHEFDATGTMLRQPYSVSFRLIQQTVLDPSAVDPSEFTIQPDVDDVVIEGTAAGDRFDDVVAIVLRELGRVKGR